MLKTLIALSFLVAHAAACGYECVVAQNDALSNVLDSLDACNNAGLSDVGSIDAAQIKRSPSETPEMFDQRRTRADLHARVASRLVLSADCRCGMTEDELSNLLVSNDDTTHIDYAAQLVLDCLGKDVAEALMDKSVPEDASLALVAGAAANEDALTRLCPVCAASPDDEPEDPVNDDGVIYAFGKSLEGDLCRHPDHCADDLVCARAFDESVTPRGAGACRNATTTRPFLLRGFVSGHCDAHQVTVEGGCHDMMALERELRVAGLPVEEIYDTDETTLVNVVPRECTVHSDCAVIHSLRTIYGCGVADASGARRCDAFEAMPF